jgi:transcriptional regulator with XRE-family HTH domain
VTSVAVQTADLAPVVSGEGEWQPRGVAQIPGGTVLFDEATTFFYEHTWHQFPGDPEGTEHVLHALMLAWAERQLRGSGTCVTWAMDLDADKADLLAPVCLPRLASLVCRRMAARLSQETVAEAMHSSQAHLSKIERGGAEPRPSTLVRYAAALDALLGPAEDDEVGDPDGDETRFSLRAEPGGQPWIVTLAYPRGGAHGTPVVLAQALGVRCDRENSPQVRLVEAELALVAGVRARPEVES